MSKVEMIEEIIKEKESKLKVEKELSLGVRKDANFELTKRMIEFFDEALSEEIFLEVDRNYLYFKKLSEGYTNGKEILSLSFRGDSWRDDDVTKIETNFYSTTENSIWELERMVTIGKVGAILLDFSDDIIASRNECNEICKEALSVANKKVSKTESEIRDLNSEIEELKRGYRKTKLLSIEGIKFKPADSWRDRINLDVRWDWRIHGIRGVKVVRVTPSGKSYDLDLTVEREKYNEKTASYYNELKSLKVEKVRAVKVHEMIDYNSEKIVSLK